ncbi:hypothetical protein S40285_02225 [Stachybotrys chlorohalonatus IBT 40285]|uniref:Actin-related protein 2/3 complex subunit 5 n=1 Tax=Stachybotrys chlorohalonatus (strain IBT 40285) TaxID=1283841 RepID=A0A084QB47_STAC4|nr:hypothetical protein S40285_02225 [Stachybotrys chlorohalonata IBT 40285]
MSIQQYHTNASLSDAWRTINIDALTEDSSANFDVSTLAPPQPETTEDEVRQISGQVRQLLRGGDAEGALRGALDTPVYNGTDAAKDAHLQTIIEVLQSIKASDMSPLLKSIYGSPGGSEALDVLMKYMHVLPFHAISGRVPANTVKLQRHGRRTPRWRIRQVAIQGDAAINGLQPDRRTTGSIQRAGCGRYERPFELAREGGRGGRPGQYRTNNDGLAKGLDMNHLYSWIKKKNGGTA